MLELGMVRFVKNQEIDLIHRDERVCEALVKYLCSTNDDLVLLEVVCPDILSPQVGSHGATESRDFMVQIAFQDCELLED